MLAFGDIDEIAPQYAAFIEDKVPKKKKKKKTKKVVKNGDVGNKPAVKDEADKKSAPVEPEGDRTAKDSDTGNTKRCNKAM